MGSMTAQILIGQSDTMHGGVYPTHVLFLTENSRPCWILQPINVFTDIEQQDVSNVSWIPSVGNMLEDALVMIGLYVLDAPQLKNAAKELFNWDRNSRVETEDVPEESWIKLYQISRSLSYGYKLVITALNESTILNQLPVLNNYSMELEVYQSAFSRYFNPWNNTLITKGELQRQSNAL